MKSYSIKNYSTNKLFLYSLIAFILTIVLTILTSNYINRKIYPAIVFLMASLLSIFLIKKNSWNIYVINIIDNHIIINNKKFALYQIKNYLFNETEKFYGFKLIIESYSIFLNIPKNDSLIYLDFKKHFMEMIKNQNIKNTNNQIKKYNWFKTQGAKIYGYITFFIMLIWIILMILYPDKFKLSNFLLFVIIASSMFPIMLKIFIKKRK